MVTMRDRPRSGQQQAGADHAVMRHDDQAVDLLVAGVGEREHRPVGRALARRLLHAADDAVGAGRGRDLDAVGFGLDELGDAGEIDRGHVGAHVHRLDGREPAMRPSRAAIRSAANGAARSKPKPDLRSYLVRALQARVKPLTLRPFRGPCRSGLNVRPEPHQGRAMSSFRKRQEQGFPSVGRRRNRRISRLCPRNGPGPLKPSARSCRCAGSFPCGRGRRRPWPAERWSRSPA